MQFGVISTFLFFILYYKYVVSADRMSMHEMRHWVSALVSMNAEFRLVLVWMCRVRMTVGMRI